jgi:hypothetical protein
VPTGGDRVGRPSYVVGPHPVRPVRVAVDVDVTHVTSAAIGIGGPVIARQHVPRGRSPYARSGSPTWSRRRSRSCSGAGRTVLGVGVSVPGTVDKRTRTRGRRAQPRMARRPARRPARGRLGRDVPVVGRQRRGPVRAGRAEPRQRRGLHRRRLPDRPDRRRRRACSSTAARCLGRDGRAGEVGHNVVSPTAPSATAGSAGCLETIIGDWRCCRWPRGEARPPSETSPRSSTTPGRGDATALAAVRPSRAGSGRRSATW